MTAGSPTIIRYFAGLHQGAFDMAIDDGDVFEVALGFMPDGELDPLKAELLRLAAMDMTPAELKGLINRLSPDVHFRKAREMPGLIAHIVSLIDARTARRGLAGREKPE